MSTTASTMLTTAMIPSRRFVVSRFPAFMLPASSVRRTRRRERRLLARRVEFVHRANTVVGHLPQLFDGFLEPREFAPEIVNGGLYPIAHVLARLGKEEVTGGRADCRAEYRTYGDYTRLVHTPSFIGPTVCGSKMDAISSFGVSDPGFGT